MKRCVVADGSAVIRKVAHHFLAGDRWDVVECETAAEVLGAFEREPVDLALVDWQLPGMDAASLIKSIRQAETHTPCRILLVTSEENRQEIWRFLKAGADDYLLKPFDRSTFASRLNAIMPRFQTAVALDHGAA